MYVLRQSLLQAATCRSCILMQNGVYNQLAYPYIQPRAVQAVWYHYKLWCVLRAMCVAHPEVVMTKYSI